MLVRLFVLSVEFFTNAQIWVLFRYPKICMHAFKQNVYLTMSNTALVQLIDDSFRDCTIVREQAKLLV